jgi:PAS domain S-box-containing protein
LRSSEERFRLLVESVQDYAIFLLDPGGNVSTWNIGAQRINGYTADEIIGRSFEVFYPAEVVAVGWPQKELELAAAQSRFAEEGWRLRKDGTRFWASVVITALRDEQGELQGFAKVTRDLTEPRLKEEALRRSEEQFRLLVESVKDYAIYMLDPKGHVLTWNAGAAALKGYAVSGVLQRHFSMFFTAEDIAACLPERKLAVARLQGHAESDGWRVRKDGSVFWANMVLTPVLGSDGLLHGYACVTRDLSEQRRLSELEHSSRRLNEFLAMLAHELRNPLAPIRNAVSIMQMQPLPAPIVRTTEIINRQLGCLTHMVDDLLDVARIVTGKLLLKREHLDYREVVLASVEAVRPLVAARSQHLGLNVPAEPIAMMGDFVRLVQSLQNLLSNAVRYTPEGGAILLTVRVEGAACVTTVTDTGRGLAPEALGRIFELFAQENVPRLPSESGLGIGLSLARSLVEGHGGMLSANSAGLGQGSTFTMRLPLRQRSATSLAPDTPSSHAGDAIAAGGTASRRVLVIDDNRDTTDSMVYMLELLGHKAQGAYGAEQAVRAMPSFRPQIVMLDLNMPDGDGFSVIGRLRAQSEEPLYVVAMTGFGQKEDRRRTLEAGFQAHLTKPVGADELRQALHEAGACRAP